MGGPNESEGGGDEDKGRVWETVGEGTSVFDAAEGRPERDAIEGVCEGIRSTELPSFFLKMFIKEYLVPSFFVLPFGELV